MGVGEKLPCGHDLGELSYGCKVCLADAVATITTLEAKLAAAQERIRELEGEADPSMGVLAYQREHEHRWKDKPDAYWMERLWQEIQELRDTLDGKHEGPVEHELRQIGSICINWLLRANRGGETEDDQCATWEDGGRVRRRCQLKPDHDGDHKWEPTP